MFGVPVLCAVACFRTRTDTQHEHSTAQGYTAQSYKSFILNVVVSLMIHDHNVYVFFCDLESGLSKGMSVRTRKIVNAV